MHHPTDRIAHTTAFRGTLAGTRNSSMGHSVLCIKMQKTNMMCLCKGSESYFKCIVSTGFRVVSAQPDPYST